MAHAEKHLFESRKCAVDDRNVDGVHRVKVKVYFSVSGDRIILMA